MIRPLVSLLAAACTISRASAASVPHAVVIIDDGHLSQTCHQVTRLVDAIDHLFVYLASRGGEGGENRRACPRDIAVVESDELSEAADAAVWHAAHELAAFPRSSVTVLNTALFDFSMEAVKSLLVISRKSKKPTVYPVRFVSQAKRQHACKPTHLRAGPRKVGVAYL